MNSSGTGRRAKKPRGDVPARRIHRGIGSRIFDSANVVILLVVALVCLLPFVYVISASLSDASELVKRSFILLPVGFTLENYKYILLSDPTIPRSLLVSVFVTVIGTVIDLTVTSLMAYPLSHKDVWGHKVIMPLVTFTLVFGGGMIPTYLVVQQLHLLDTYWAVWLPSAATAFNLVVFISFFRSIPSELEDAARIDGCNELVTFARIILPVSKPLLATFTLMFAVANWNNWFSYVLYINDSAKWPVQVVLRTILTAASTAIGNTATTGGLDYTPPGQVVQDCVIVISTIPILIIYPFLQKYFTKGIMLGSVKG